MTYQPLYEKNECVLKESALSLIALEAHDVVSIASCLMLERWFSRKDGYFSQLWNEPLCDAATVVHGELVLFQMTIGETHGLKEQSFKEYCEEAHNAGLSRVRFVFIVPARLKFRVSEKQAEFFTTKFPLAVSLEVCELVPRRS